MKQLKGISISSGTVIDSAYVFYDSQVQVTQAMITEAEVERECARFVDAIERTKREYLLLCEGHAEEEGHITTEIIEIHTMLLDDIEFHKKVKEMIQYSLSNAEWAVKKVIEQYIELLSSSDDSYMIDRIHDFNEIGMRVVQTLSNATKTDLILPNRCILLAHNLYPSQLMRLDKNKLSGIILEDGGITSHVSIIAKAYGIPMLVGVRDALRYIETGDTIILCAMQGDILLHPSREDIAFYTKQADDEHNEQERLLASVSATDRKTMEGEPLSFCVNVDVVQEMNEFAMRESDGIGLFRSEFLLEQIQEHHDSEEKQYKMYSTLVASMHDKPVTIRSFDAGGDKIPVSVQQINESNPLLGYRGVRYSLGDKDFFLTQLRAILRASMVGNVRLLIPMVSCVEEMILVQAFIKRAKSQLQKRGIGYKDIPVGIMIEVPSIVHIMDDMNVYCDFYALGTNDLLQYTMAIDRGNAFVGNLYQYYHPPFLRLLNDIFYKAYTQKKEISLCGEMASYEDTIPLLLGMGLRNFSVSPSNLARVIHCTTKYTLSESRILLEEVLRCHTAREVIKKIEEFHHDQSRTHNSDNRAT